MEQPSIVYSCAACASTKESVLSLLERRVKTEKPVLYASDHSHTLRSEFTSGVNRNPDVEEGTIFTPNTITNFLGIGSLPKLKNATKEEQQRRVPLARDLAGELVIRGYITQPVDKETMLLKVRRFQAEWPKSKLPFKYISESVFADIGDLIKDTAFVKCLRTSIQENTHAARDLWHAMSHMNEKVVDLEECTLVCLLRRGLFPYELQLMYKAEFSNIVCIEVTRKPQLAHLTRCDADHVKVKEKKPRRKHKFVEVG